MCIFYCCEGRKLDNSLGYYVTLVKKKNIVLYCIVLESAAVHRLAERFYFGHGTRKCSFIATCLGIFGL